MHTQICRRIAPVAGVMFLLTACGGGGDDEEASAAPVDSDGWQQLLQNDSLAGWSVLGDANWRFEDGSVLADESTAASFLVSESDFSDFELELEFWVDTDANSGVFFRCNDRTEISDTICYEANIFDTRPDQTYRSGSIVNVAEPAEFLYTGGQWNRYRIRAEGSRLQVELNGREMVDVEDSQLSAGPIALQYGMGTVRFRNVRIRAL